MVMIRRPVVPSSPVVSRPRVVFVPGLLGSVLVQRTTPKGEARVLWGTTGSILFWRRRRHFGTWQTRLTQGNGLNRSGPVDLDVPPTETPDGLIEFLNPYAAFIDRLRRQAKADLLVFPYDWRLSIDWNAILLEAEIQKRWFPGPARNIHPSERVTIQAHSMGGLVSRYFIEAMHGHRYVKRLVTVGTPHQGAPEVYSRYRATTQTLPDGVMPLSVQLALLNHCASARQHLPNYDFVFGRGFSLEPRARTYAAMPRHPTGLSVMSVIRLMRDGFQPQAPWRSLDAFLNANNVFYDCIGSSGRPTVRAYDSIKDAVNRNNEGDGTVPLMSALCPEGPVSLATGVCTGTATNIRTHVFQRVVHFKMFKDQGIQDLCLSLLDGGAGAATREFEVELASAEAALEAEEELAHSAW
jgi:hypothetical protein